LPREIRDYAPHALVLGAVLLVHGPSVAFGLTGLDDQDLVGDDGAFLRGPVSALRIFSRSYMHVVDPHHPYYRPLVTASFALDAHWPGASLVPYHATNVLIHACTSLLFLGFLRRFGMGTAATVGALVFAVHPALAAAVAWIPGRNDSLLTLFVLAAWQFLPFGGSAGAPLRLGRVALHGVFFGLALLTKETALVAPAVWAVHAALHARPDRANRRPWMVVALGWLVLVAGRLALAVTPAPSAGAKDGPVFLSLLVRSLGPTVLPLNPALLGDPADLSVASGLGILALAASAAALVAGVRKRVIALGAVAYAGFSLPAFFAGTTLLLATRLYLPACGVLLVATEVLRALFDRAGARRPAMSFAFVAVAALALVCLAYESTFANRRRFARAETDASPHCAMAHFCLGASYQMDGDDGRAMAEFQGALALGAVEVVHNNIAVIEMRRADWLAAEADLRREIAVNPGYARALRNLAIVLRHEGLDADAADAEARAATVETATER
jgi:hypothetical protein